MMKFIGRFLNKIVIMTLILLMLLGYGIMIEPNLLRINNFEIGYISSGKVRVVQFADTHLDNNYTIKNLEKLVRIINLQKPDIIVFTGDLIDCIDSHEYPEDALKALKNLEARIGKVAVFGNHDYGAQGYRYYEDTMNGAGFEVLINSSKLYTVSDKIKINVVGLDDALLGNPDYKKVSSLITKKYFDLLIMHEPDEVEHFEKDTYDLALAGHSHGGQIRIPFIGEINTPPLAKKYVKGLYDISEEKKLYVSSGVATTVIPVRLFNLPEIAVFDIML